MTFKFEQNVFLVRLYELRDRSDKVRWLSKTDCLFQQHEGTSSRRLTANGRLSTEEVGLQWPITVYRSCDSGSRLRLQSHHAVRRLAWPVRRVKGRQEKKRFSHTFLLSFRNSHLLKRRQELLTAWFQIRVVLAQNPKLLDVF
jgi:hypothetical protein